MPKTFVSYRQFNDSHSRNVRVFAEQLRERNIEVILDQFFLEVYPGGPADGWPKWSSDQAAKAEHVVIIGSESWFRCFDGEESPGTGLGAACEAAALRQRIYDKGQLNHDIRIILLSDGDASIIPIELKKYHHFHAERDFEQIVKWIGSTPPADQSIRIEDRHTPKILGVPPRMGAFYGRTEQLQQIAVALEPETRTWGAVIAGPGGMGKTSLAIRAAHNCRPGQFKRIVFVSVKQREMDDDGVRQIGVFLLKGYIEMLNELSRLLGHPEIVKEPEDLRIRLLHEALQTDQALLILDNLESLTEEDRAQIRTFLHRLPAGCKAIVTSRPGMGSGEVELHLYELDQEAALQTIEKLSKGNKLLERSSLAERTALYEQVGGNPLLLHWVAGQVGSDRCRNLVDAIKRLTSCPANNDPLEFILGDLVEKLNPSQVKMLCTLNYFTAPVQVRYIAPLAELDETESRNLLKSLANLSLIVPADQEEESFALAPLAASYLRSKRSDLITKAGDVLKENVYSLVIQYGGREHHGYGYLEKAWPKIDAALPQFSTGTNEQLQAVCDKLWTFLNFTNRCDEWFALSERAERRALASEDFLHAGWRAYDTGCVHRRRGNPSETIASADRAADHWDKAQGSGPRERAFVARLRGHGHRLGENYQAAIIEYQEAVTQWRSLETVSKDLADGLRSLAEAQRLSGDLEAAEKNFREALQIAKSANHHQGVAKITGRMAELKLNAKYWKDAEALSREALELAAGLDLNAMIAENHWRLAQALVGQNRGREALPHGRHAEEIFTNLRAPALQSARALLQQWKNLFPDT